jgi:Cu-processing system permease protein
MGYSGAVFQKVFSEIWGKAIIFLVLSIWAMAPFWLSLKFYQNKDL